MLLLQNFTQIKTHNYTPKTIDFDSVPFFI